MTRCTYVEDGRTCRRPAVGELGPHDLCEGSWPMCDRHIKPEAHPQDLHDKLVRWQPQAAGAPHVG